MIRARFFKRRREAIVKRTSTNTLIAAFIALFAVRAGLLRAQTPTAAYLPMGPYTNDFSAPMPNWWFLYSFPVQDGGYEDLLPIVFSNDYAVATEGFMHRFAITAAYHLDVSYWMYGGAVPGGMSNIYWPYDSAVAWYWNISSPAQEQEVMQTASMFWAHNWFLGVDGTPPWGNAPGGTTNAVNIGQLKNAFSLFLDDIDNDAILDEYEIREFGTLDFADSLLDDPGGNGLCLLASIMSHLDPLAQPDSFHVTNQTAKVSLFPGFYGHSLSSGDIVYERTFPIHRSGTWQHYFLVRNDTNDTLNAFDRLEVSYSDASETFHVVAVPFAPGDTNMVVRLPLVSPNQTNLTIRLVTAGPVHENDGGYFGCPSLSLVSWSPKVEFPTATRAVVDGRGYFAFVPDGVSRLEIPFTVDWSDPPDGSNPTEDWGDGGGRDFPLVPAENMETDVDTDNAAQLPTGGTMRPSSAGIYPLAHFGPLPQPPTRGTNGDEALLVASPRLTWPSSWHGICRSWLDYDQVAGTYSNCAAYPLDSQCLQEAWHYEEDGYCGHAPEPTLDLGDRGLDQILDCSFTPVSDFPPTSRCTVTIAGSNIWEDVISHYCPSAMRLDCGNVDSDDNCDCDCDCGGSGVDGDAAGSCEFRLALGFPLLDTVSGFLWFRTEDVPRATPSMLSLMVRGNASVTCENDNPGGAISHVRCTDPRGRDVTVAPIDNGLRLTVSNAACTFLDHSWEITNPGNSHSKIRIRKISRLNNPLSDHTYETFQADPPDAMFATQSQVWRITDSLTGLVETRIVSDGLNDPGCRARWVEVSKTDAGTGKVYSHFQSRSAILGTGVRAVLRETYRVERTFDPAHPRETFSTYWDDEGNQFLHGKVRLTYGDRLWTYLAYDALGRETLRLSQLDGSPCPVDELEALLPETLAAAISAIPASTAFSATVTDYEPLDGDSEDDLDASLPRTVAEYEVRNGTPFPASRTWTVYNREGFEDYWDVPVLSVRTERAATPASSFGDQGNAVSTEVSYDIRDGQFRTLFPFLDGLAVESTGENGVTTRYFTDEDDIGLTIGDKSLHSSGRTLIQTETDMPLPGRAPDPNRPQRVRCLDMVRGTELMSGSCLYLNGYFNYFDFSYNLYDDQDRLRATFFPDGSSTTNAYSCCRLLWSQDRDGRKTVRSALTGQDRLYYANLEPSIADFPHFGSFGPHAPDRTYWGRVTYNTFRITQHFMDAFGRETNTVTSAIRNEGDHDPGSRTFTTFNPYVWRSNATVAYPDGVSGHSLSTDARGLVTESFSRDFPDRTESTTVTYPRGEPSNPFSTNIVVSYRNGAHVSERRWDGGWTRTTESSFRDALGRRTTLSVTEASDLDDPVTNSLSVSDFLGRTILAETPLSSVTYVYDGATSRVVSETDSNSGITTLHHYDAYGEPAGSTRHGVTSLTSTTYVLDHGDFWRITASVVSNGVKTASSTETRERLTGLSNALRSETISFADGVTNAVSRSAVDSEEILTVTTVSPTRGTNIVQSTKGVVGLAYDASGYRLYSYDQYGRLFHTLRIVPGTTTQRSILLTMRNDVGDVIREDVVDKRQGYYHFYSTYHAYDCRGNRIATTNALGGVERRAYDALGRPIAVWGSAARPTLYSYDTQGRRTSLSTSRSPSADAAIEQALAASPNSPFSILHSQFDTTQWQYDPATGLCLSKVYPSGPAVTNTYTADGLLASRKNASQGPETFTYDANRRLVSYFCDDMCEYGYDGFGNRIHSEYDYFVSDLMRDDRGAVTNEYHEWPETTIATAYDDYGRMVSRTVRGRTVRYAYAPDGQLATISNEAFRVDYLYTPDRLDAGYVITTTGGVEIARHVTRDTYRRHLVTAISTEIDDDEVREFSYSYDALGRPVSRNDDDFAYNARSEVSETTIGGVDAEYLYDPAGNRTTSVWDNAASVYTANGLNQYGTIASGDATNTLTYGKWGNLTQAGTSTYQYFMGLLTRARAKDAQGVFHAASYENDAEKRRRYKHVPSGFSQPGDHYFTYSGWSLQVEDVITGANYSSPSATIRYIWGKDLSGTIDGAGGVGGLLATEVGGVWYFPLYDNNGNVTDYVSETGDVVASYEYDAFGRTLSATGSMASAFPFRFSTKYYDAEADLYYYGYRYYSPELGRWLTRDPIEEGGGDNLYAFCGNNGVNRIDMLGRIPVQWGGAHTTFKISCGKEKRAVVQVAIDEAKANLKIAHDLVSLFLEEFHNYRQSNAEMSNFLSFIGRTIPRHLYGQYEVFLENEERGLNTLYRFFAYPSYAIKCDGWCSINCMRWNGEETAAYVDPKRIAKGENKVIHLCPAYFNHQSITQARLLVHEASHAILGTVDSPTKRNEDPYTWTVKMRDAQFWESYGARSDSILRDDLLRNIKDFR